MRIILFYSSLSYLSLFLDHHFFSLVHLMSGMNSSLSLSPSFRCNLYSCVYWFFHPSFIFQVYCKSSSYTIYIFRYIEREERRLFNHKWWCPPTAAAGNKETQTGASEWMDGRVKMTSPFPLPLSCKSNISWSDIFSITLPNIILSISSPFTDEKTFLLHHQNVYIYMIFALEKGKKPASLHVEEHFHSSLEPVGGEILSSFLHKKRKFHSWLKKESLSIYISVNLFLLFSFFQSSKLNWSKSIICASPLSTHSLHSHTLHPLSSNCSL